jgi:radical SAM protein (TIGR01212 family)
VLEGLWSSLLSFPEVVALCVGTRPDCVPDPVLDLLARYRERWEVWLELGLQSARDDTLARLGRGHTAAQFADACRRARARGLMVCAHVILGLPGEGPGDEARTAAFLGDLGAEGVKLHHLAVVRGTALERSWRAGDLRLLEEAQYAARAVDFVRALPPRTILHRLVGDTAADRLLAPHYDKARAIRAIRRALG